MIFTSPERYGGQRSAVCAVGSQDHAISIWWTAMDKSIAQVQNIFEHSVLDLAWYGVVDAHTIYLLRVLRMLMILTSGPLTAGRFWGVLTTELLLRWSLMRMILVRDSLLLKWYGHVLPCLLWTILVSNVYSSKMQCPLMASSVRQSSQNPQCSWSLRKSMLSEKKKRRQPE